MNKMSLTNFITAQLPYNYLYTIIANKTLQN